MRKSRDTSHEKVFLSVFPFIFPQAVVVSVVALYGADSSMADHGPSSSSSLDCGTVEVPFRIPDSLDILSLHHSSSASFLLRAKKICESTYTSAKTLILEVQKCWHYTSVFHFLTYFPQISSQKKKTGVIAPKRFIPRLKKQNELFRSYMHQNM
ncbi:hypothetical protein K1719_010459 [Acacia pycnantha]|nr:hypothetical protein K1719_010459 [Acacia pycnantha]